MPPQPVKEGGGWARRDLDQFSRSKLEIFVERTTSLDLVAALGQPAAKPEVRRAFAGSALCEAVGWPQLPSHVPLLELGGAPRPLEAAHALVVECISVRERFIDGLRRLAACVGALSDRRGVVGPASVGVGLGAGLGLPSRGAPLSAAVRTRWQAKLARFLCCVRVATLNVLIAVRAWRRASGESAVQPIGAPLATSASASASAASSLAAASSPGRRITSPSGRLSLAPQQAAALPPGALGPRLPPCPPPPLVPRPFVWEGDNYLVRVPLGTTEPKPADPPPRPPPLRLPAPVAGAHAA